MLGSWESAYPAYQPRYHDTLGSEASSGLRRVLAEVMVVIPFRDYPSIAVRIIRGRVFIDRSRLEAQYCIPNEFKVQLPEIILV